MRNAQRAIVIIAALALGVFGATKLHSIYERNARLIHVGDHRIDPLVPMNPEKRYGIVVWEQTLPWHGGLPGDRRLALETAAAEFMSQYPNVHVEIALHDNDDFVAKVLHATTAGVGPDIVGLSDPGLLIDRTMQVPVSPYMSPATTNDVIPAVRRALLHEGTMWVWPRWVVPATWLVWRDALDTAVTSPVIGATQLLDSITEMRQFAGVNPPIGYNAFDAALFGSVAVASGGVSLLSDVGAIQWSEVFLTKLGTVWLEMVQSGALHPDPRQAAVSRLSRFDARQSAIVASPSWPLIQLMMSRYGDVHHDTDPWTGGDAPALRVMSAPYFNETIQGTWGQPAGYAVLVQSPTAGDDHIAVAMRLAEFLSWRVGAWEAATHIALPAYTSALPQWEIDSGLAPEHIRSWYALTEYFVGPPVPRQWAIAEAALLEEIVVPAFVALIDGDISAEQFGRQLTKDMEAYVAAKRPKNGLALQIP